MISSFLLAPAVVPGLVSLRVSLLVSSFLAQKRNLFHHYFLLFAGSGSVSGAGLASCLASCLPSCLFFLCSKKGVCSTIISCFLLVPALVLALVPGLVSLHVFLLVASFCSKKESVPS